jgi:hypothetical protein
VAIVPIREVVESIDCIRSYVVAVKQRRLKAEQRRLVTDYSTNATND